MLACLFVNSFYFLLLSDFNPLIALFLHLQFLSYISVDFHSGNMQLQELKISVVAKFLPSGWKALRMRQGNFLINFILSPDGKRFDNLEDAQDHYDKKELKKEMTQFSQKTSLALSEAAKFKRKFKAEWITGFLKTF